MMLKKPATALIRDNAPSDTCGFDGGMHMLPPRLTTSPGFQTRVPLPSLREEPHRRSIRVGRRLAMPTAWSAAVQLSQFMDIQCAVVVDVKTRKLRFHVGHELLFGNLS